MKHMHDGLAEAILKAIEEARAAQAAWLSARGLTLPQARALPQAQRAALQAAWSTDCETLA